jgi:hypothetical protein
MPFVATEQTLEKALVNLDRLDAVGLTERFDESVVLFTRVLGWQPMVYSTQNVAAERPRQPELPPETLEAVVRYNALDLELYRHAGKRLTRAAAADGDDFAIDVAALRRATQCIAEAPEGADLAKLLPVSPTRPSGRLVGSAELREQLIEARAALLLRDAELERLRDPSSQSAQVEAKIHTRPERKGEALEAAAVRHRERIEKNESRIRVLVAAGEAAHSIELGELRRAVADLKQRLADIQERQAKIGLRDESSDDGA